MTTVYFSFCEIPVTNMVRALRFYNQILGLELESMNYAGAEMAFFPREKGHPGCALIQGDGYVPGTQGVHLYLDADGQINHILKSVELAGGSVVVPLTQIEENHFYASFLDSEGNQLSLFSHSG